MTGRTVLVLALLASALVASACAAPLAGTPRAPASPAAEQAERPSSAEDGRHFAVVTKVRMTGGDVAVVVDYARMLRGKEASEAAAARGDLFTQARDYLIVNDDRELRTFPVSPRATVRHLSGSGAGLQRTTPTGFVERWLGAREGDSLRHYPYWLTVENGVVTQLEQQYLP